MPIFYNPNKKGDRLYIAVELTDSDIEAFGNETQTYINQQIGLITVGRFMEGVYRWKQLGEPEVMGSANKYIKGLHDSIQGYEDTLAHLQKKLVEAKNENDLLTANIAAKEAEERRSTQRVNQLQDKLTELDTFCKTYKQKIQTLASIITRYQENAKELYNLSWWEMVWNPSRIRQIITNLNISVGK